MKELLWIGSSLEDLRKFPEDIQDELGYALYQAQVGIKSAKAKPLTGIFSGIMEISSNSDAGTFRAIYAIKLANAIYVLHCFQKKSTHGISTPKKEISLIKQRYKEAISWIKFEESKHGK